jgi:hypothetical protein
MKLANISIINKNTDKLIRNLKDLNILSEPFSPPLIIPTSAEPRLNKMTIMIAIIIISITFYVRLQKKRPHPRGLLMNHL